MINALILMICYANHVVSQKASEEFNFAGPILLQSSNLLYTFINFYEEYIVSFEINPMSIYQTEYGSVIHLTANGDYINYGDRNPAVFFNPAATQQGLLSISTSINGSIQNFNVKPLPLNEWSLVEILQEFVDSNFVLSISINKTKLYSSVNSQTIKQSNVKLYASNPWHSAQDGYIRNLYVFTSKTDFSGCINGDSTNLQLTASGYHVKSNISCISVCNSYSPPIFSDAFFLEGQLCFCRNASLPPFQISTTDTCVTSTCLNNNTTLDCSLTNFAFFSLSLGIIEWNIVFNPAVVFVDKEVEIQTNILKGNASNAFVVPLPNDLPLLFQNNVNNTIVKAQFYLPGLQIWSQTIGNAYTDPFNVTTWVQVDEDIGRVFVIPSTVQVNGFYNFFLVITQGTNISVKISLPMNKILSFTADLLRLSYGFDVSLLNTTTTKFCQLSDGYVLKQVVLTSGHFTKLMVKASTKGSLKIDILRPLLNTSADFCPFEFECAIASLSNESVTITAVVVKKFIFLLNSTGIIEILIQSSINDVQENDLVWIGGSASLFCNEEYYNKIQEIELGKTTLFSTDQMADGFFISLFISKSFECLIPIPASAIGLYNFTVDVYSHVSPIRRLYYLFPIQNPVSGLQFENQMPVLSDVAGYKINKYLYSKAVINGSDVTYLFIIPELNCSVNTTNTTAMFKMTSYGNFTVYLAAANKVNLINTSVNIVVLSEINSISMNIIEMQLQYSSYETVISINNGNRVQLTLDFGDETPVTTIQNIDATDVVVNFSIFHTYSKCSLDGFNVTATASNILVDSNTIINSSKSVFKIVIVFCKLSTLNIVPTPIVSQNGYVSISPNKNLLVTINQDYGSYRNYLINWGDGSTKWINQSDNQGPVSFQERHIYQTENRYIVSVTCRNLLDFSNNSIIVKVINCSMPGLSFYYGTILSPMNVIQSVGAELAAVVENPDSFCPKLSSIFQWNLTNSNLSQSTVGTQVQQKVTYTIQRNQLLFGLYNLTLTYKYGEETNIYIAYLNVTESPLLIVIDKGFFNSIAYKKTLGNSTLHQNFTISASSSFDRDDPTIGIQNITFMWRCKIASNLSDALDAMSNFTLLNLTYKSDTCFNETWVNVSFGNSKINFSTHQFLEGISYHIEVCGKKYAGKDVYSIDRYKEDCFTQKLYMVPRGLPILSTICVSNCDKKLNFKERVIYTFKCEDCGLQILEAQWDIADDAGNFPLELSVQNATTTGFHSPCLVLNKDILIESKNYTFVLIFGYADSSNRAKIKFTKSTCSKPKPGVCYANPAVGFALETKFNIICDNWKDSDGLLRYMFYYNNGQTQHMNVSTTDTIDYPILNAASTDQPSLFDFLMGPGDKNNDDQVTIIIKVSNKYQAYTEYKHLFIKVQPNDKPVNVTDLITGIDLNDTQSLANLVQAVSSTTNKMSANYSNSTLTTADNITGFIDNAALNQEKQRQLSLLQDTRTHMIGLLNNATINDLNSFKTIGDALALTSQNPIELVSQSQKQASNIVAKMSELLTIQNLKNIGADKFDTMTQPFLKSISNLFQTSLNNNESDSVLPTLQTTTSSTTSSLNLELDINGTSFLVTKCKCTHLTSFGGFFVAPNPIRKPTLSMLKNGYVLTVAVAIALFIWIIGLIFCRRMDKKDVSKIGVSPLLDNRDEDNYMYQLIVYTGNRKDAGTESNIFFTVAGDMGDSEVRRLKGSERKCFQRSSCDMFIMTTQSSLGDLDYIRFWHDNSGGGWYIKNIIIIDLQTEKQYLFIGNRWLAVDRGSYSVDCVLPAASVEEQNDFTYIFTSKAKHNLSDEHLWFSVLARSPKSNFTRCQRLSVAVSLLLTSMMVSAMFYGLGEGKQDPATENKSVFSFTRTQISVVLICTFIKFPVHLLLVKFFRSIKPFQISNDKNDSSCDKSGGWKSPTLSDKCNSLSSNQKLTEIIVEKNVSLKKKKFLLPHCYLFVAWFFCVVNILGSAVVVLFYGMSFGNKTSLNWLATVTIDLVKEVFFTEPIKLFVLAVFFALFIKNIKEEETDFQTQGKMLALDESWLHKPKHEPSIFDRKDIEMQPLNTSMVLEMRDLRIKNLKMYSLFKELALYIFYAILVMFIGYSTRKNVAFRQTRNVQDLFNLTLRRVPWPRDYSKIYGQIQATPDFWNWMDEFFLRQVFPEPWYKLSDFYANSDKKDFPGKLFLNDLNSKIVNGIRIRQVRVQPNSCVKTKSVAQFIKVNCMSSYTSTLEETGNFYLNWTVPLLHNSDINPLTKPWRYQTWKELDGYPYAAKLETYYGGGYVVEIFPKWKNKAIIDQVKKLRWIDRQTRAILIEFALFNAATNYISMVTMVLEFPASSGVIPTFCILTFRLYSGTKEMLISHFIFILMTMLFTVRECRFLYRVGCKYFVEFWNLVEVALILFSVIEIGFFFYKDHLVKLLLERMPAKKPQTFINFQFASYWDLTHVYIVSLIVFFVTLKFIKLLRFNRHISLLSSTLKAAWYPLSMFFIMFSIVMCSVVTTSRIVFGSLLDGYQNYFKAIASIISLLLGKFSYSQFQNANGFLGPIFFFGFNIMVNWVVMNIFLTILNDAFTDVREELQFQQNEYEIVDFITEHFKAWLGWSSPKNNVENTPTNQNLNSTVSENNDHYNVTRLQKTVLTNNESTAKFDDCLSITNQQWEMKNKSHKVSRPNKVKENSDPVESDCAISIRISELSKYDYLLNEGSLDVYASELLGKFIYCINYVYKANEAMGEKKDLGKRQFKKKVYSNSNLVIINSKNREVFKDLV
ncbi:uncharacterized protein LOC100203405 isoform X4 [Hydra vulgaris]|uniref:Uncharacterized protein LOC100203405 isoform X4 n=1 Tax=Hydra vulgaris TaxID=6087 RepID=A0ABM4CEY3_HYDVU